MYIYIYIYIYVCVYHIQFVCSSGSAAVRCVFSLEPSAKRKTVSEMRNAKWSAVFFHRNPHAGSAALHGAC